MKNRWSPRTQGALTRRPPAAVSGPRRSRGWLLALAVASVGSGCTGASVVAAVDVPTTLKSTCIRVVALSGTSEITSSLVVRPTEGPLMVAIYEPQGRERPTTLVARGYVGDGCEGTLRLNDESAPVEAAFRLGPGGAPATLTMRAPPPALDADGDGYRTSAAGGPDCDDRRASVRPGLAEVCGDGADNDCDAKLDCEQDSCLGQPCGGGRSCTATGACEGREAQCTNATDDDLDGLVDCLDPDCASATCDDGDPCTTTDRCQAGQCSGAAVTCNTPPAGNACLGANGTCNPADGGCVYPALAGQGCGGANVCAHDGGCGPLYSYTPANFTPPDAGAFVPLRFECGGTVTLDTTPGAANPWGGGGALCGQFPPPPITRTQGGGGSDVALVPVRQLVLAAGTDLVVTGSRPVIFAVFGDAQIDGRLWFAWGTGTSYHGAGVTSQCSGGGGQVGGSSTTNGGGGGGGGSYGTAGAGGGQGQGGTAGGGPGGTAGNNTLVPLMGGCAGGYGGSTNGPIPGGGGGAIQISATDSLVVRGAVAAPGGGGTGGQFHQTGGAGGGSGGALLLEARSVRVSPLGFVTTNGGGGGEGDGCCSQGTLDGNTGGSGPVAGLGRAGGGGNATGAGGNGGAGAGATQGPAVGGNGATLSLPGITYNGGGGGGGGGLGRIRINAAADCQVDGGQFSGALATNGASGCP